MSADCSPLTTRPSPPRHLTTRVVWWALGLALACRLPWIWSPLLDAHSWRQTETAAIARNYYEGGFRFLYPECDWGGKGPYYIGCEFPVYPYLVSLTYAVTGVHEWVGRAYAVLFSLLSTYFLFRLAELWMDRRAGLVAACFFAASPNCVFFTRNFMPESLMLLATIGSFLFLSRWYRSDRSCHLLAAASFAALALLVKLPSAYLLLPAGYLLWCKFGRSLLDRAEFWGFAAMAIIPAVLWYGHAQQLHRMSGLSFNIFGGGFWGDREVWLHADMYRKFATRFFFLVLTPVGCLGALLGLLVPAREKGEYFMHLWLLAVLIYVFLTPRASLVHYYYLLPLTPVAGLLLGRMVSAVARPWLRAVVVAALPFSLALGFSYIVGPQHWYRCDWAMLDAARAAAARTAPSDLIAVCDEGNSEVLYYAHRKGWHLRTGELASSAAAGILQGQAKLFVSKHRLTQEEAEAMALVLIPEASGEYFCYGRRL